MAAVPCFLLVLISLAAAEAGTVGINYGRVANVLPSPNKAVKLLRSLGLRRVKLYDTDPQVLSALSGTGISAVVALPNEQLAAAAADRSFADSWVGSRVAAHLPSTKIEAIAVGNEVFVDPNNTTSHLVGAMKNVHASLVSRNLASSVKVSSPIALSALQNSYPPSQGSFKKDLVEPVIKPMLEFLRSSGSHLMVNAYPFFAYSANAGDISLDYALFRNNPGVVDPSSGLTYFSLFDAQIDAVHAALAALNFKDLKLVVSETGWPSKGDSNEVGAGVANAAAYNGNLMSRVLKNAGTPLRPDADIDVFLFALFNENQKPGSTSERNYGLFYPNEKKVYDVHRSLRRSGDSVHGGKAETEVPSAAPSPSPGQTWCVANGKAGEQKLEEALNYACGAGGADCRSIQQGATCFDPNTVESHASHAFNSFYQRNARRSGTCDFDGAGHVVTQRPSFGGCDLPAN